MKTICPHCKQEFPEIPDEYLGMTLQCSVCEKEFVCEKPKFCIACGNISHANAIKCSGCGSFFQQIPRPPVTVPPVQSTSESKHKSLEENNIFTKQLIVRLIKYTLLAMVIGYVVWYNLPSNRQKRADKKAELNHIQTTYMANHGETDDFEREVRRLRKGYPQFGGNATTEDHARSVKEIVTNWNAAVKGFKNADKKMFTDADSLLISYALMGTGGAYRISKDFDLLARILLIKKSQAEAAEIGRKIYEAVEDDDIEEKEKLLKEYDRLINMGNLWK